MRKKSKESPRRKVSPVRPCLYYHLRRIAGTARCFIVEVNGDSTELFPGKSRLVFNHSPCGFEWGYGGSGPSQLALAIMLDFCERSGEEQAVAVSLYQEFKRDFLMQASDGDNIIWSIIQHWLQLHKPQTKTK